MNISMGKNWFIFLVASLVLIGVTGPANAADVRQIRPTTRTINPTKTTVQATVRSVTPNNPSLTAGGSAVDVTVSGTNLNLVTAVQLLKDGRISKVVKSQLGPVSSTSRQVTLSAGSTAPAGIYTVRLMAGTKGIDLSASVVSLTVKVAPTTPTSAVTMTTDKSSTTAMRNTPAVQQESRKLQTVSNVAKAKRDIAGSSINNTRGGDTEQSSEDSVKPMTTLMPSAAGGLAGQRQAMKSPKQIQSSDRTSMSRRSIVDPVKMAAPDNLGEPRFVTGPRDPTSPEAFAERYNQGTAGVINGTVFHLAVKDVFSAASFRANSCGGTWEVRRIMIDIPNTYYNNSISLSRLDYELTDGEKESSQRKIAQDYARDIHIRISKIRACVDDWLSNNWTGGVEGGAFKVSLPFQVTSLVKTRAIERWDKEGPWIWTDRWDWNGNSADSSFPDYVLASLILDITLTPNITNGTITYSGVDARWNATGGDFQTPLRESYWAYIPKIIDFKGAKLEEIRQRAISLFNENSVRNRISDALTEAVLSNPYVNQVTALTGGSGGEVTYGYE